MKSIPIICDATIKGLKERPEKLEHIRTTAGNRPDERTGRVQPCSCLYPNQVLEESAGREQTGTEQTSREQTSKEQTSMEPTSRE